MKNSGGRKMGTFFLSRHQKFKPIFFATGDQKFKAIFFLRDHEKLQANHEDTYRSEMIIASLVQV